MIKYTIKKGDTLSKIAKKYNVPMTVLANLNDIEDVDKIFIGHRLIIPQQETNREDLLLEVCAVNEERLKKDVLAHAAEVELLIEEQRKELPKHAYYKTNNTDYLYKEVKEAAARALYYFSNNKSKYTPNTYGYEIIETFRTQERQNHLYEQGRTREGKIITNAKGGQSMHNYGLALDVVPYNKDKQLCWEGYEPEWKPLITAFRNEWFTCGADWGDKPHFSYNILYHETEDEKYITGTGEGWRYFVE